MGRSPLAVAALVFLLVTAGCFGFFGEGETPDPATSVAPTETGTPTPTASPTPAAIPRPTTESGAVIGSPEEIARSHEATLRNTSFRIRYVSRRVENGTTESRTIGTIRYDGDGVAFYNYTVVDVNPGGIVREHVEVWSNGTRARRAIMTENGTVVETASPLRSPPTFADEVELYLRSFRIGMTGYSRFRGDRLVRITGAGLVNSREQYTVEDRVLLLGFVTVESGRFTADIADGAVRRYRIHLSGRERTASVSFTEELTFTGLGTTTVDRPAWVTSGNATRSG
jgi:hypothetical protein